MNYTATGAVRRTITLCFFLLTAVMVSAQSTTIKGELLDSLTHEGEPFATVRVFKQSNLKQAVGMSVTDVDGKFNQPVKGQGAFVVAFSSVGKATLYKKVTLAGEKEVDLGTLLIGDDANMLADVEVTAQAPLVKMETDKMSYNVSDDVDAKSSTVLDMLRKVPMVTVDGQDNITVNGSSSFKIYVDGKPNAMLSSNPSQILKAMPASMVKNIEVVTNPGARYDAEGVGGVLNFITAQGGTGGGSAAQMNGYNGSVSLGTSTRGTLGANAFVSVQQGKLSLSANLMGNAMRQDGLEVEMSRVQKNVSQTDFYQKGTNKNRFHMESLSFNYDIDSLSTLGGSFSYMGGRFPNDSRAQTTVTPLSSLGERLGEGLSYNHETHSRSSFGQLNASLDYQRFLNADRTRSITLSYLFNYSPNTSKTRNIYDETMTMMDDYLSDNRMKTQEHTVQIDYATPIAKGHTLDMGTKFIARSNMSDAKYYTGQEPDLIYNEAASMNYKHLNDILAGYAEYAGTFGKFGTKAGVRYEHTWQRVKYLLGNGTDFHTNYGNLVPSASLTYNLAPTQNIGLTYNMRISRPSISYLNPYVERGVDYASVTYGNSDLDVEKSHNFGLVVNSFTPKLMMNINLRQSFSDNNISQYSFYKDDVLNTTYGNIVKNSISSMNIYMNWSAAKKTRLIFNGGVSYTDLRSRQLDQHAAGWSANSMFGLQQTLPWDLKLSANLIASTKSYSLQGWNSGFSGLFGTLTKSFLNEKFVVSLIGFTALHSDGRLLFKTYSEGSDFYTYNIIRVPIRQAGLKLTYNFGNMKQRAKQHQSKISNDFMEDKNDSQQTGTGATGMGMGM